MAGCGYGFTNYGKDCGCAAPVDGLFDIYYKFTSESMPGLVTNGPLPPRNCLLRSPSLYPQSVARGWNALLSPANTPSYTYSTWYSQLAGNWNIPLPVVPAEDGGSYDQIDLTLVGGFPVDQERVWVGALNVERLWLVDAVNKTVIKDIPNSALVAAGAPVNYLRQFWSPKSCGFSSGQASFRAASASQDELLIANLFNNRYLYANSDGDITYGTLPLAIRGFAPRYWPIAWNGAIFGEFDFTGTLKNTTLMPGSASIESFDIGPDGWVAATVVPGNPTRRRAVINGEIVIADGPAGGSISDNNPWPWSVHAAHPHETLGGGYFVICQTLTFNASQPNESVRRISVFKGTTLVWTAEMSGLVFCESSSDRWLYFRGGMNLLTGDRIYPLGAEGGEDYQIPKATMPNPVRDYLGNNLDSPWWLVKHDGSQSFSGGRMLADSKTTGWPGTHPVDAIRTTSGNSFPRPTLSTNYDVVKNSALVKHSLPADATELASFLTLT